MLQMLSSLKCRHFATVIKGHAIQISIMLCIQEAFKILTTSLSALDHIRIMNFVLKSVKFIYLFYSWLKYWLQDSKKKSRRLDKSQFKLSNRCSKKIRQSLIRICYQI